MRVPAFYVASASDKQHIYLSLPNDVFQSDNASTWDKAASNPGWHWCQQHWRRGAQSSCVSWHEVINNCDLSDGHFLTWSRWFTNEASACCWYQSPHCGKNQAHWSQHKHQMAARCCLTRGCRLLPCWQTHFPCAVKSTPLRLLQQLGSLQGNFPLQMEAYSWQWGTNPGFQPAANWQKYLCVCFWIWGSIPLRVTPG